MRAWGNRQKPPGQPYLILEMYRHGGKPANQCAGLRRLVVICPSVVSS